VWARGARKLITDFYYVCARTTTGIHYVRYYYRQHMRTNVSENVQAITRNGRGPPLRLCLIRNREKI